MGSTMLSVAQEAEQTTRRRRPMGAGGGELEQLEQCTRCGRPLTPIDAMVRQSFDDAEAAALAYAELGWRVLPCHSVNDGQCTCGWQSCHSPGKHPLVARGVHAAEADPEIIRAWWQRWPWANVAIATGAASGIYVVDVDPRHGGDVALIDLVGRCGRFDYLAHVLTGSNGDHYYRRHPGTRVPNSAGKLGPGLDVRGDGGFVVAPPSRHISGERYLWLGGHCHA